MASILTNIGRNKLASASPLDQVRITHIAVGDGAGGFPPLLPDLTSLTNEVWRGDASAPIKSGEQNVIIFEGFIPGSIGGFDIREMAIFDEDGDMIAIGHTALVEKPAPESGSTISLSVRMHVALDSESQIDLIVQDVAALSHAGLSGLSDPNAHPAGSISSLALPEIGIPASDLQSVLNLLRNASTRNVQQNQSDTTVGRVLLNGAHGLGDYLAISDANLAVRSGFYSMPQALGALNSPLSGQSGSLLVINGGANRDFITQIWSFSGVGNFPRCFVRQKPGTNPWTAWSEFYTSANAGTAAAANIQTGASDATPGRVLINGGHGLGGNAILSTNFNNITTTGFYRNGSADVPGAPFSSVGFVLIHIELGNGSASQICFTSGTSSPETYRRHRAGSSWTSWSRTLNRGEFGIGSNIPQGEILSNIDNITLSGLYGYTGTATGSPSTNGGSLLHIGRDARPTQIASDYITGRVFVRTYLSTGWRQWAEIYTSQNQLSLGTTSASARAAIGVFSQSEADGRYARLVNNLSDIPNKSTARANLDVYSKSESDARYWTQSQSDARFLRIANNLSDLNNAAAARGNLGVWSQSEADGRYSRLINNLSDLPDKAAARNNLQLGSANSVTFSNVTAGGFDRSSDERLKKNKRPLVITKAQRESLKAYIFEWTDHDIVPEQLRGTTDCGAMAQAVEAVFPSCVKTNSDTGYKTVDYGKLAVLLQLCEVLEDDT